jgi:DNA-binding response OmpR family regulator
MATSARQAVMLPARGDYDLILPDVRMSEFDGKQLFRFLDEHMPKYRNRLILLTGDTGNPETMLFLEKNRTPYLTKPLDIRGYSS